MKKKKLNLKEISVESFTTSIENENPNTIKGGFDTTSVDPALCSGAWNCENYSANQFYCDPYKQPPTVPQ